MHTILFIVNNLLLLTTGILAVIVPDLSCTFCVILRNLTLALFKVCLHATIQSATIQSTTLSFSLLTIIIILLITLNKNIKLYYITAKERNTQKDKHVVILDSDE